MRRKEANLRIHLVNVCNAILLDTYTCTYKFKEQEMAIIVALNLLNWWPQAINAVVIMYVHGYATENSTYPKGD